MPQERTDQPSNVSTQDTPRPRDQNVVTSDLPEPGADDQETPTPAAASDQAGPTDSEPAPDTDNKAPPPKRNRSAERRIKKLSAKLSTAEQKEAENARRIEELEETVSSLKSATPKAKEPMLQDFANPREYAKAYAAWEKTSASPAPKPRPKPKAADTPATPATPPPADDEIIGFRQRGVAKLGDEFQEALQDQDTAVSQTMGEFMIENDVGPELYVHLTNNQEDARKIYDMTAPKAIKALEALATKAAKGELDVGDGGGNDADDDDDQDDPATPEPGQLSPTPKAPAKKQTKAPTPPSDPSPGSDPNIAANPETEPMDAYAERRRKEEARKMGYNV